ncbi:M50 family metallopeptidase [Saccharibacillus kuerlensis]|uniref:Peptidase M50 domain-containing protein n=1 Tax=Saccharibacillus kuerlensis TaxID=459527 RepID=A0ABQ2L1V3_9BACL|nr:M50 family metallopeptidase [Saccharibacillus kuerlensis]GGN99944.1 hypothetical protein GCM10010969_20610 [Saccharibacillus kuerlensis]
MGLFKKIAPPVIGAVIGWFGFLALKNLLEMGGSSLFEEIGARAPQFTGFWLTAAWLLGMAVLAMFTILLHEFGHVLAALLVGSRVTRLYWGPFILLFPERRLRFTFRNKLFFGAMQNEIGAYRDEASFNRAIRRQQIVYAGGPAFSLVTGLIALILAPSLWSLPGGYGVFSVAIGLATLFSDGTSAVMLGRRNFALMTGWTLLVQDKRMDAEKRDVLEEASVRYLQKVLDSPIPSKGRNLYDLYLLYDAKLMEISGTVVDRLTHEVGTSWAERETIAASKTKIPKMRRDVMMMILGEEVVRLCEAGERDKAEVLYEQIGGRENRLSPLLLKAKAYIEGTGPAVDAYMESVRSMRSDIASFGAFYEYEEHRLRRAGLSKR